MAVPSEADLVAFGLMLSGAVGAVLFCVWGALCFSGSGPFGATLTMTLWAWKLLRKDPFPLGTIALWGASTFNGFPAAVRLLIATAWWAMILGGVALMGVDMVKGPKETRYFTDPVTGQPRMERTRMKEKRQLPPKLDKALRDTMPARDRLAHGVKARRYAKNQQRAEVGLGPLPESPMFRALTSRLPTGKTKEPKLPRGERAKARRDARAEVAELPPPPPVDLGKGQEARLGDPASPPPPPARPKMDAYL